jgi:hypothetical protein
LPNRSRTSPARSITTMRTKKERKTLLCPVCKRAFIQKYACREDRYCSKACWSKRNPKELIECKNCGNAFAIWKSTRNRKRFCIKDCYSAYQEKQTADKSHLWKGGKTNLHQIERTRAIYTKWRNDVFARDNFQCQDCGVRSGNGKRIILNAHHIRLFSEDEDKKFAVDNGITLCKPCHTLRHPHLIKQIAVQRLSQEVLPF